MQPLLHKRILVTRSPAQAEAMCRQLEALGATAVRFPVIDFIPLPASELKRALANLPRYDWLVFTSGNAVRFFWQSVRELTAVFDTPSLLTTLPSIAAVGPATQQRLAEKGITANLLPGVFTGEQLALALGDVAGKRILLPRAKAGRPEIVTRLRQCGALVDEAPLYETVTAVPTPAALAELAQGVDVLTFTSPSSVRNLFKIAPKSDAFVNALRSAFVACIGPSTAAEAQSYGLQVDIMPAQYTIETLVTAVAAWFQPDHHHTT